MKTTSVVLFLVLCSLLGTTTAARSQVRVVNIVPAANSGETNRDAEPNLAGDPSNPLILAASAFTPDPNGTLSGVLYFSTDGGLNWNLTNAFVPASGQLGCFTTYCDITLRYAGSSHNLYTGFLSVDAGGLTNLSIGSVTSIETNARSFTALQSSAGTPGGNFADQPWVEARTVLELLGQGNDRPYVNYNDVRLAGGNTATIDLSLNPLPPPPSGFNAYVVDTKGGCGQDGPAVRGTVHLGGTVYVAFYRWTGTCSTADIVVVRDDNWGTGPTPFRILVDPSDNTTGQRVATGVTLGGGSLGNQRVGSQIAIAVDPNDSRTVYVAWGDGAPYTLHVRRSLDNGQTWSGDLRTVASATNPGLAINSQSEVAFLYQALGNPGTGNRWRTHLERTTNGFTTNQDLVLADIPDQTGAYGGANPIGDYDNVIGLGKDFYGVFSGYNTPDNANFPNGVSYLRFADFTLHQLYADNGHTMPVNGSIDPFFFHITELPADRDFHVRDWTDSPTDFDLGQEPSTHPVYWSTSDVWNRATNTPGSPNASGWFPTENVQAGTGSAGDNYAFVRVHRSGTGSAAQVTAHFLVAPFGAGSNFQDAGTGPDQVLNFAAADNEHTLGSGFLWHQDPTTSEHACMAVQISTTDDPFIPPTLAGTSPRWPEFAIPEDNNKAQRNLDVSHNLADAAGIDFALIHNSATFAQDVKLRFNSPDAKRLRGAQIQVVGGETKELRPSDSVTMAQMQPGENRWVALRFGATQGGPLAVNVLEDEQGQVVNGFTMLIVPVPLSQAIRDNLREHVTTVRRLNALFNLDSNQHELMAAQKLLRLRSIPPATYLEFLRQQVGGLSRIVVGLSARADTSDPFQIRNTLDALRMAVAKKKLFEATADHGVLLHQLDALATMLQKSEGEPADILQMVRWQLALYSSRSALTRLECSGMVIRQSQEFVNAWERRNDRATRYPRLLKDLADCFTQSANGLETQYQGLQNAVSELKTTLAHASSLASLERAHWRFLLDVERASR